MPDLSYVMTWHGACAPEAMSFLGDEVSDDNLTDSALNACGALSRAQLNRWRPAHHGRDRGCAGYNM